MTIEVILPPKVRDYRLDLLRGIANWATVLPIGRSFSTTFLTTRSTGLPSGTRGSATPPICSFFISGYTASFLYARIMLERGVLIGATRLIKRAWQIYVAHIILFVMYVAEIGYLSQRYNDPNLQNGFTLPVLCITRLRRSIRA